ncbi:PAS domain S-box protein [Lysinibacillus yapensis]|uniref:PAS domain S-box protein n=1 Tax=Ureibacillus yapensis TaxID=2304605 RepID=A0A396S9I3_9BACL|nr:SpoIIE family protein phosphatase [Lysinibacillus yapensis]RHW37603.1 PAS domain S-box protein [Lysinibacillus yapensis]
MDDIIENAPCGFMTLSANGKILTINQTLVNLLQYPSSEPLIGKHFNVALSNASRVFIQLYFFPIITLERYVEEMYVSLVAHDGEEIPVLLNASFHDNEIICAIVPMHKRNALENELIKAKKMFENAYSEKEKALSELEAALLTLKQNQLELLKANQENAKFKLDTERDLQLAKTIQETSLTKDIVNDKIKILSYYHASKALSGDIYGFYEITPQKYGIILLDVMGHGISSSLITMSLQSLFHKLISQGVEAAVVMQELDQYLHELFQDNQEAWHYCTAIYLNIDTKTQTIEYLNAGHPPAILQDQNGLQEELFATSPPLGMFKSISFTSKSLEYTEGTRILLYTDGVSEALEINALNSILKNSFFQPLSETKALILKELENSENKFDKYDNDDQCFILVELSS